MLENKETKPTTSGSFLNQRKASGRSWLFLLDFSGITDWLGLNTSRVLINIKTYDLVHTFSLDDDEDVMAPDPAIAGSSGGGA
jgi:hypothetical protein